ncbi:hypothetical protein CANCADRAFT_44525 [Tortispora caseinolytica NRRL Y-17796]|uniref:Uncharacterized protein n=1 Tax=Tortispora caseinolytica NRRL Y-17796 TaxID=767744 RepID=A0A1E4TGK2_9ASCO|nr:hypothetical protein CANCADRAFT_44525 [Tortispora caseinolytica NRRL Y-17796]
MSDASAKQIPRSSPAPVSPASSHISKAVLNGDSSPIQKDAVTLNMSSTSSTHLSNQLLDEAQSPSKSSVARQLDATTMLPQNAPDGSQPWYICSDSESDSFLVVVFRKDSGQWNFAYKSEFYGILEYFLPKVGAAKKKLYAFKYPDMSSAVGFASLNTSGTSLALIDNKTDLILNAELCDATEQTDQLFASAKSAKSQASLYTFSQSSPALSMKKQRLHSGDTEPLLEKKMRTSPCQTKNITLVDQSNGLLNMQSQVSPSRNSKYPEPATIPESPLANASSKSVIDNEPGQSKPLNAELEQLILESAGDTKKSNTSNLDINTETPSETQLAPHDGSAGSDYEKKSSGLPGFKTNKETELFVKSEIPLANSQPLKPRSQGLPMSKNICHEQLGSVIVTELRDTAPIEVVSSETEMLQRSRRTSDSASVVSSMIESAHGNLRELIDTWDSSNWIDANASPELLFRMLAVLRQLLIERPSESKRIEKLSDRALNSAFAVVLVNGTIKQTKAFMKRCLEFASNSQGTDVFADSLKQKVTERFGKYLNTRIILEKKGTLEKFNQKMQTVANSKNADLIRFGLLSLWQDICTTIDDDQSF